MLQAHPWEEKDRLFRTNSHKEGAVWRNAWKPESTNYCHATICIWVYFISIVCVCLKFLTIIFYMLIICIAFYYFHFISQICVHLILGRCKCWGLFCISNSVHSLIHWNTIVFVQSYMR
jgi:hypothetical protein